MTWADFHPEIVEAMANMEPWPCEIIRTGCGPCGQPSVVMGPNGELVVEGFRATEIEACFAGQPPPRDDLTGYVYHSTDGGLEWAKLCDVPLHFRVPDECDRTYGPQLQGMGFLRDGTLLSIIRNYYGKGQMSVDNETFHSRVWITRSTDRGETWNEPVELDPAPYELVGGNKVRFHQLRDGTVLMPMSCTRWSRPGKLLAEDERVLCTQMYASSDNGKTWSTIGNLGTHSDESDLLELPSGRILASTRFQRIKMPDDPPELNRPDGERGGSVYKQTAVFYSDDGGRTFSDHRLLTGWLQQTACLVRLSDGTVVLPFGHKDAGQGQRFMISYDEGETWGKTVFELNKCGMYASSVVLADDTIVTAFAVEWHSNGRNELDVLRWRVPPREVVEKNGVFRPRLAAIG